MLDVRQRALLAGVVGALVATTVWAFVFFDKGSHSASDTIRPLLITMVPLWALVMTVARSLISRRANRPD